MTAENWVVQVSPKLPDGTLINLRAESAEQMEQVLAWAENHAADIARVAQTITAAANVVGAFPGAGTQSVQPQAPQQQQPTQGQWGQQQGPPPQWAGQQPQGYAPPPPQQAPQPQGPGPMCAHGPMQWKEGVGKTSGKPFKGWFCPSRDRSQQCETQWVRG